MARETWLNKLKTQLSHKLTNTKLIVRKSSNVGILAFEIAGLMSKLLELHQSISDKSLARLKNDSIHLQGVRKIVSNDDSFLLTLAAAELLHCLHLAAKSTIRISQKCEDPNLRSFPQVFDDFTERGRDPYNWVLSSKEFEALARRAERQIAATSVLYREMEELSSLEKKSHNYKAGIFQKEQIEIEQKISWQRQEVKCTREKSLWNRSFDAVTLTLAQLICTILARIKLIFGIGHGYIATLPRSLSASATVFPSDQNLCAAADFISGPLKSHKINDQKSDLATGFFESNTAVLKPPSSTLGASGLALHYANLIIVLEKMVRSPQLVGMDARDELYAMLPRSVRASLRARLKGVWFSASDPSLAGEWRDALGRILGWLSPLAHNMIKWQTERSFEQQNLLLPKTNVLLLQTLYFANKEKTEAAITELLVGLNYIWRFEREINAKALFECYAGQTVEVTVSAVVETIDKNLPMISEQEIRGEEEIEIDMEVAEMLNFEPSEPEDRTYIHLSFEI
ncbi:hypothetical protein Nepgr_010650 [Nepenthes gracilis]|uniref:Uncharacterized protein n=1 Tax=Nepenthes gracilis TaxID=150966 RepID=A0AAD3SCR0_NEPGR|nr:hypothetical protein Nepgr_010650 [Nepenthes gracilis]